MVAWNDERPRSTWIEQLYLAERLQPEPALIPANADDRVLMFGLINEICGENGLVYQKDLGPNTAALGASMVQYNPDASWKVVE